MHSGTIAPSGGSHYASSQNAASPAVAVHRSPGSPDVAQSHAATASSDAPVAKPSAAHGKGGRVDTAA